MNNFKVMMNGIIKCMISTSLDGPKDLHDMNRPLQNKELDHHVIFEKNLAIKVDFIFSAKAHPANPGECSLTFCQYFGY